MSSWHLVSTLSFVPRCLGLFLQPHGWSCVRFQGRFLPEPPGLCVLRSACPMEPVVAKKDLLSPISPVSLFSPRRQGLSTSLSSCPRHPGFLCPPRARAIPIDSCSPCSGWRAWLERCPDVSIFPQKNEMG